MSRSKNILIAILFLCIGVIHAQENVFLQRDFWKTNPSISVVDQKISEGNAPTQLNSNSFDPVVYAILENADNKTIMHLLSKEGNGINKLTHDGRTYIFWAAYKNNQELMQYLVENGAKMDITDDHGNTVLTFAASTGQTDPKLYDFLLANGSKITETNKAGANVLLLAAPNVKDFNTLDYFTSKGIGINSTDGLGNGMFNYVARTGNIEMLKTLLKKGIKPNTNNEGGNAMLFAAQGTRGKTNGLEVYTYLESVGVQPNVTTTSGTTPLHILAYRNDDTAILDYFVKKGVNVNSADENGDTALLNASRNTLAVVQYLIEKGANVNTHNENGETPLLLAISGNSPDVAAYLIEEGASVDVKDKNGNSPVYYLLNSYSEKNASEFDEKLILLQKDGIDISEIQGNENNAYHLAVEKNDLSLLKKIEKLNISANINAKNSEGLTPLHLAAMKAKDETILKYLLSQGANKSEKTDFEETAYDLASENELLAKNQTNLNFLQ